MLFEPSGVLRCDYAAYCHVLGLTEREEVYRSLVTNEELQREKEAKCSKTCVATEGHSCADVEVKNPPDLTPKATVVTFTPGDEVPSKPRASNTTTQKKRKSSALEDLAKAAVAAASPAITFIMMRQLKICLNVRDMKPLALAIPHCTSLVSVEFVGCGLSQESYLLLVEGIYKGRRVCSVTVDFNSIAKPGFYDDPTVKWSAISMNYVQNLGTQFDLGSLCASPTKVTAAAGDFFSHALQKDLISPLLTEDCGHEKKQEDTNCRTFVLSEYRGLNSVLSPLEFQLREEKERKGKVDSKKQIQVQLQKEQIAQLDKEYPLSVPRGWSSVLLTGVKHLSLRGNGICDAEIAAMASLLIRNPRCELVTLNLWGNCITNVGAISLARVLKKNRTLQVLDLGHNKIGDTGLLELVDCFRMMEVPIEELQAYRRRYLTRRDASARERQLAASLPPPYPTYQELYAAWYHSKFQHSGDERKDSRKGSQGKGKRTETFTMRPSTPFDRDCVRMENGIRVPGNTVLRCVNLGNNKEVTLSGAREALRILRLCEPNDDDMSALQNSATKTPELYCASIMLRTFVFQHDGDPEIQVVQRELTEILHERQLHMPQPLIEIDPPVVETKKNSSRHKK